MTAGRWTDLDRPVLDPDALTRVLERGGTGLWGPVTVVERTGSTNADVAAAARDGAAEGLVLVAEEQTGGRGRLDRAWTSPPRAGLTLSVLLRPDVASDRLGLLPLLAGCAVAGAVADRTGVVASVKWPNDVVVEAADGTRKLAGLLMEAAGGGVVVGLGLNVSTRADELPVGAAATSLALETGEPVDRATVLLAVLRQWESVYEPWRSTGGDPERVLPLFRQLSSTLGRSVRVLLPTGTDLVGTAIDVEPDGRLRVRAADGAEHVVGAGDVVHVRRLDR